MFSPAFKDGIYIMIKRDQIEVALIESVLVFSWFWDLAYLYVGGLVLVDFVVVVSFLCFSSVYFFVCLLALFFCEVSENKRNTSRGSCSASCVKDHQCKRSMAQNCCVSYQSGRHPGQDVIDASGALDQDETSTSLSFCCQKITVPLVISGSCCTLQF